MLLFFSFYGSNKGKKHFKDVHTTHTNRGIHQSINLHNPFVWFLNPSTPQKGEYILFCTLVFSSCLFFLYYLDITIFSTPFGILSYVKHLLVKKNIANCSIWRFVFLVFSLWFCLLLPFHSFNSIFSKMNVHHSIIQ